MHVLQDGYSFWVWPWFVVLIVIGSWFAVNLALVVIATQFKMTKKREIEAMTRAGNTASSRRLWEEFVILFVWLITCGRCVITRRKVSHIFELTETASEPSSAKIVAFSSCHTLTISPTCSHITPPLHKYSRRILTASRTKRI